MYVRTWIVSASLCFFLFILPLQCFFIGNDLGLGVQGATYRWQMTVKGDSFIPFTQEINYIFMGIYTGRTALSVILWTLGTLVLTVTTLVSLVYWDRLSRCYLRFIIIGIISASIFFMISLCVQYGLLLSGPAGSSLPIGIIILFLSAGLLYYYQDFLFYSDEPLANTE